MNRSFRFVDRTAYLKKLLGFISQDIEELDSNIMWVRGESRVGVSSLLGELAASVRTKPGYRVVSVCLDEDQLDGGWKALDSLLGGSQSDNKYGVFARTSSDYSLGTGPSVAASMAPGSTEALIGAAFAELAIKGVVSALTAGNPREPYLTVCERLAELAEERDDRVVLIIDHLHYAKGDFYDCLTNVMAQLFDDDGYRIIVGTCCQKESDKLTSKMLESFCVLPTPIEPFDQTIYFFDILSDFFKGLSASDPSIAHLFDRCGGSPGRLRTLLQEYRLSGPSEFAIHSFEKFAKPRGTCNYDMHERAVAGVLSIVGAPVTESGLVVIIRSVAAYYGIEDNGQLVLPIHAACQRLVLDGLAARSEYQSQGLSRLTAVASAIEGAGITADANLKHLVFDAVEAMDENGFNEAFPGADRQTIMARLAWHAGRIESSRLNLELAVRLINQGRVIDALPAIDRFLGSDQVVYGKDDFEGLVQMAHACYDNGQYEPAKQLLRIAGEVGASYRHLFLSGKVANVLHEFDNAESFLLDAEDSAACDDEAIAAKSVRQQMIVEIPGRADDAYAIFDELHRQIKGKASWSAVECMAMRTAVDFENRRNDVDAILARAIDEAGALIDRVPLAYLTVALGLQALRARRTDDAYLSFSEAQEVLASTKPHEQAYAYNNMGVCKLVSGNYDEALSDLRTGLAWGSSPYIRAALSGNLAVTYSLLGRMEDVEATVDFLWATLNESESGLVKNRASHAICFSLLAGGLLEMNSAASQEAALFDCCLAYLRSQDEHDPSKRARVERYERFRQADRDAFLAECRRCGHLYRNVPFQPWISTLQHD